MSDIRNIIRSGEQEIGEQILGAARALSQEAFALPGTQPLDISAPSTPQRAIVQLRQIEQANPEQRQQILRQCTECWRCNAGDQRLAQVLIETLTTTAQHLEQNFKAGNPDSQEVFNHLEQADRIARVTMGENSLEAIGTSANLGRAYINQGQADAGEQLLQQALTRQEAQTGPLHRDSIAIRQTLILNMRDRSAAQELANRHLTLTAQARGENHIDTAAAVETAAEAAEISGNPSGAAGLRRRAAAIAERIGNPSMQIRNLTEVCRLALQQDDNLQADAVARQTIELARRTLGNENIPHEIFALSGSARAALGDTEGAEQAMAERNRRIPNLLPLPQNLPPAAGQKMKPVQAIGPQQL